MAETLRSLAAKQGLGPRLEPDPEGTRPEELTHKPPTVADNRLRRMLPPWRR
jgi:hypothetical protein